MDKSGRKGDQMPRDIERGTPPPPVRGTMQKKERGVKDLISDVAGRGVGGGGEQEAANMVMQGAEMLMQAAQMDPRLMPIMRQAIGIIQQGIMQFAGGAGAPGAGAPGPGAGRGMAPSGDIGGV
jgi:hypothetical protein